jgi:REP element-mobilizing transposase RayT
MGEIIKKNYWKNAESKYNFTMTEIECEKDYIHLLVTIHLNNLLQMRLRSLNNI